MKQKKPKRGLVTQSLENISRQIFRMHSDTIAKLIERSAGIYALYDDNELYYVGKATQLRKRVRQHLKDRHMAGWTHFSLYLVRRDNYIGDIESLLIRIANPKGNTQRPKGRDSKKLKKQLENLIKQKHKEELRVLFSKKESETKYKKNSNSATIKGMVQRRTPIYRTYKGKEYKAILTPAGSIYLKGKKYTSPSAAAMSIVKRPANGWWFWRIRNSAREWVLLKDYNS